jgi:hypothetical protein
MDTIIDWTIHHFQKELGVITGAPILSLAGIGLSFLAAWFFVGMLHKSRHSAHESTVDSKDARIELLEGQLGDYKEKLSGATPVQAARAISELREDLRKTHAQMDMITKWYQYQTSERHLSEEQKTSLAKNLESVELLPDQSLSVCSVSDPEAQQYAIELLEVFQSKGLCTDQEHPYWTYHDTPDERGVLVVVPDENDPPLHAIAVYKALTGAGIAAKYDTFSEPAPEGTCTVGVSIKLPPGKDDGNQS